MQENGWVGNLWMEIDCPHAGNWVLDIYKNHQKYNKVIANTMIDVSCDHFNTPDWLVHVVLYKERENAIWLRSNPLGFTKNFPCAAWPNPGKNLVNVYVPYPN